MATYLSNFYRRKFSEYLMLCPWYLEFFTYHYEISDNNCFLLALRVLRKLRDLWLFIFKFILINSSNDQINKQSVQFTWSCSNTTLTMLKNKYLEGNNEYIKTYRCLCRFYIFQDKTENLHYSQNSLQYLPTDI